MVDFTYNDYQKISDEAWEDSAGDNDDAWSIAEFVV